MKLETVYTGRRAATYDSKRSATATWQKEQEVIGRAMRESLRPGDRVLDIAAGTGRWLQIYAELGAVPTLLDVSEDMLAIAAAKATELGVEAHFQAGDLLGELRLPGADWAVVTRFFNWIDSNAISRILGSARERGVRRALVSAVVFDEKDSAAARWTAIGRLLVKNFQAGLGTRDKGRYFLHREADLRAAFAMAGFDVASEETISRRPGEAYKLSLLERSKAKELSGS